MVILIINICKEPLHYLEFVKPIEDILKKNNINFITKHYKNISDIDISYADKIIISGTSLKDNEFLKDVNRFKFLIKFKKPVLGICGGSHIIGLLLGYKLNKKTEIGFKDINIEKFLGINGKIQAYYLHNFFVLSDVFHKNNFYAILFHPEVRNKEMILNFCNMGP
ncbi:MAG: hypothetical protein QXD05_02355 [Candidatus Pacearchaeota archaeon]